MEETIAYVYKWTYKPTYKWYIGSRTAKGCNPDDGYICSSKIVKPMIKSNPDEWIREIIATGKPEEMRELEAELLDLFDAKNDTRSFNMHNGDGKFTTAGKTHSDESRAKISAANKGKPHNEEHRAKISAANKGKTHNEETRAKMSASRKGRTFTEEHRAKMSASNKGKTHSPETRAKLSALMKGENNPMYGKKHSEEHRAKLSAANKGKTHNEETRAKMSAAKQNISDESRAKMSAAKQNISSESRAKMSAAKKGKPGKPHNEETRAKISASMKGIPKPQQIITCPHCNKSGGEPLMKRYHFDNCKLRII
jgi:hypothetical protein